MTEQKFGLSISGRCRLEPTCCAEKFSPTDLRKL